MIQRSRSTVSDDSLLATALDTSGLHKLTATSADALLSIRIRPKVKRQIATLLSKNSAGTISADELRALDGYLAYVQVLDYVKAQARLMLNRRK